MRRLLEDVRKIEGIKIGNNDLDMFKVVGYSVAMENASENIKKVVDEITLSNDEDGVAIFLDKLLKEIK